MRSGKKNALVSIFSKVETSVDATYNTPNYTLTAFKTDVFCDATPRRGREMEVKGQVYAETYMKFDFEYFDVEGITAEMLITHEGISYDIKAILADLPLKGWLSVDTTAVAAKTGRA